jgi:hypothetical protein
MKKLLPILGCIFVGILMMPAFLKRPAHDEAQQEAVVIEGHRLLEAFAAYREEFDAYPAGGQAAMIRELRGENAKQQVFFESPSESLDDKGELLDPWGSPYRITFDSATGEPLIHSAGKNRLFESDGAKHADDYRSWKHHK